jgi:hypothetical protein
VLDFVDPDDSTVKSHWAVLVAGSAGWGNYRHQADVCHAYQVLRAGGLQAERIIVLMYDDIAHNAENPRKGTIVNSPGGPAPSAPCSCPPPATLPAALRRRHVAAAAGAGPAQLTRRLAPRQQAAPTCTRACPATTPAAT